MNRHRPMGRLLQLLTAALMLPTAALAQTSPGGGGVQALYPSKAAAEKAAKQFPCTGAHQMGDKWMPCATHPELEPPPAAQSQRP